MPSNLDIDKTKCMCIEATADTFENNLESETCDKCKYVRYKVTSTRSKNKNSRIV